MLTFERWHQVFKKCVRDGSGHHLMSGLRNVYAMVWSTNTWQCASQFGTQWCSRSHHSTITGRRVWSFNEVSVKMMGNGKSGSLGRESKGLYVQVQDAWTVADPVYDALRDLYRRDRRVRLAAKHFTTLPMDDPDWRPTRRRLSDEEAKMMKMTSACEYFKGIQVNGKFNFRTKSSQLGKANDDSIVKTWYHDADDGGKEKPMYGVIQSIFTHCLYPGGPREVVLECEWLQTVLDQEQGNDVYLPQVRFNPDSNFNQRARLVLLRQCAAYNIMIAPHDPWDEQCTVYDVLDRWRTYEDHSLS